MHPDELDPADALSNDVADDDYESYAHLAAKLRVHTPGLEAKTTCPACKGPDAFTGGLFHVIIHLNDKHHVPREEIADWLDTLDVDLTVHRAPNNAHGSIIAFLNYANASGHVFNVNADTRTQAVPQVPTANWVVTPDDATPTPPILHLVVRIIHVIDVQLVCGQRYSAHGDTPALACVDARRLLDEHLQQH